MTHPLPQLTLCAFAEQVKALRDIRHEVFVQEQQVPEEEEWDEHDDTAIHALITAEGQAVACGRLQLDSGKIGRVAVKARCRRQGLGLRVMQALEACAQKHALKEVWLNAQLSALAFYQQQGYQKCGATFMEAGIEHIKMTKLLRCE